MKTFSRFRSVLREDLRKEVFARNISDLEHACQIIRGFYVSRGCYIQDDLDDKIQSTKFNQSDHNTRTTPVVPSKKKVTKKKDMLKVYPGPTLALNAINAKIMVMWRVYPSKSEALYLGDNKIRKGKTQRNCVPRQLGNDSDDATVQGELSLIHI